MCHMHHRKHGNCQENKQKMEGEEEHLYLLKSGSAFTTSLKNMAAWEAKAEVSGFPGEMAPFPGGFVELVAPQRPGLAGRGRRSPLQLPALWSMVSC